MPVENYPTHKTVIGEKTGDRNQTDTISSN
jgi:hypothetical protein